MTRTEITSISAPGRLVHSKVWHRYDGRRWIYKKFTCTPLKFEGGEAGAQRPLTVRFEFYRLAAPDKASNAYSEAAVIWSRACSRLLAGTVRSDNRRSQTIIANMIVTEGFACRQAVDAGGHDFHWAALIESPSPANCLKRR